MLLTHLLEEKRYSELTVKAYRNDLSQFVTYCQTKEMINDWSLVTPKMVRRWEVSLMAGYNGEKYSPRSVRRKISSLKTLFKYYIREGILETNPAELVLQPQIPSKLPVFVGNFEMNTLLDDDMSGLSFSDKRDHLVVLMAYLTGMRRAELVGLRIGDVDLSAKEILVRGKGSNERIVPMLDELVLYIKEYIILRKKLVCNKHDFFFITNKGKPVYDKFIYRLVVKYLAMVTTQKKKSPHVLRHSFATSMLNNGACIEVLRKLLGHKDLSATQVYTHNSFENLKRVYNQSHPRDIEVGDS